MSTPGSAGEAEPGSSRQFRVVVAAAIQSIVGDQVARVALMVLVFHASHSALLTALAYAVTFLPGLAGALAGRIADRMPRRTVMVSVDLVRAALFAGTAVPASPPWLVCILVALSVAVGGPFQAASTAFVADLFAGSESYARAVATRQVAGQLAQLAGFAIGGVVVAAAGTRWGLALDAATFALSATMLRFGVTYRPPAARAVDRSVRAGWRLVAGAREQRRRLALICLVGFWIVPEGLAAPYAARAGAGPVGVGLLLSALPVGFAVGSWTLVRKASPRRAGRLERLLPVLAGALLIGAVSTPPLPVALVLWMACGAATAYLSITLASYIAATPTDRRGQAAGLSAAAGLAAQGSGVALGGLVAELTSPGVAVGAAGLLGCVCAAVIAARGRQASLERRSPVWRFRGRLPQFRHPPG